MDYLNSPALPITEQQVKAQVSAASARVTHAQQILVALDVDGTILHQDTTLSLRVARALVALADLGAHLVLATGRGAMGVAEFLTQLRQASGCNPWDNGWIVSQNGAMIMRMDPGLPAGYEVEKLHLMDPAPPLNILRKAIPGALFAVEPLTGPRLISAPFPPGELSGESRVVDFATLAAEPVARLTVRAPDLNPQELSTLVEETGLCGVDYVIGWSAWMDIGPSGVSKATGITDVCRALGWQVEPQAAASAPASPAVLRVAVGDGSNDIEMLRWADLGVAMGQANATVQAAADLVTGPVQDDGLAWVLEALHAQVSLPAR